MGDSLRIALMVTRSDVYGGAVIHVRDLALGLQGRGHDVRVLIGGRGPMVDRFRAVGIDTVTVPGLDRSIRPHRDARALGFVTDLLAADAYDLLHGHTAKAGLLARVAAATRGVPCVYTPHAWPFLDGVPAAARQAYLRVEQAAGRLPATVINVCRYEQAYALARGVGVPRRHFTVHNGVPDVGRELRADPGASPPRMLVVARFEPQKDHATLLSALRAMPRRDWSLELVGDGPLRAAYERDVVAAGLGERVRFVGEVDDVEARMAASQVVVLASRWEGLPLVLLEAMRAGLPVVATDVGGVAEAVVDGVTGLLVPRGDARRLAGAMAGLVRSPGLRARMGAAARQRYEDAFTLDAMVEETLRVYRTTLARRDMGSLLHAVPGLADDPAGAATASRPTTQELTP